jgi:pimeloyl-ACP methyl ester carboxylesterase
VTRAVLIPGTLGSVLEDTSLTDGQAREICRDNLGRLDELLRGTGLYPCDKRPQTIWGGVGSLHWLFAPSAWEARMRQGNGLDNPGPLRPIGLFEAEVTLRGKRYEFKPYSPLVRALENAGVDLLVFPYDFRLSIRATAALLEQAIRERWHGEGERVTLIGHSMGGLVARCMVESSRGRELVRRVITIGTPHIGAPHAYLHFAGITYPFPENPFYRWARLTMRTQFAGQPAVADMGAALYPGPTQTAVVRAMASAVELMPVYDFVTNRGRSEPYREAYGGLTHSGTGRPALELIDALRRTLVGEDGLEPFLGEHGLDYHLIAADNFKTVSGYRRDGGRILTTLAGDGTVPLRSAHPVGRDSARLHLHKLARAKLGHMRLCERADVHELCIEILTAPQVTVSSVPLTEDYVAMTKAILRTAPAARGVVMTVAHLLGRTNSVLLDPTTELSPDTKRQRLKNPPARLTSPDVYEVESPHHGTFRYVWIQSNERSAFASGGVAFLPTPGSSELHLVTFNTGPLDVSFKNQCGNAHHAEVQLIGFVEAQPARWRSQIARLRLRNRSRQGPNLGYSPCTSCCDDLANFMRGLNDLRSPLTVDAGISWERLYDKGKICGHPTDSACIRKLRESGWGEAQGPRPEVEEVVAAG